VLEPVAAWVYLAAAVGLALTPALPLIWVAGVFAAVFTYRDRRFHGFPAFWWTLGVVCLGPLVYVFFVYKRPKGPIVFTPADAISQRARIVRGLPPRKVSGMTGTAPSGWYPDPTGNARVRYWDGTEWTDHLAD
jgi:Protein of unknown function (DUF2510)